MDEQLPNIFKYTNFRKYLEDYRNQKRILDPGFTHAYICHKLGQRNSRSFFNNVISGRKNVSSSFIDLFIKLLELKEDEAKYFRLMVNYNQAYSVQEKEFYFEQLIQMNKTPKKLLCKDTYKYFSEWYHSTIRAFLDIYNFQGDYKKLAQKLKPQITTKQARESIFLLKKLGLIDKNSDGFLKPTEKVITTEDCVKDQLITQYQLKTLDLAKEALLDNSNIPKKITTMTVSISDKGFERIMNRFQQFKKEVRSIVHKDEDDATKLYQINAQIFPQTK